MEFHHGLWNGVSALFSEGGRQLGEENTRPFSLNHHIPAETIRCKYKGSREGRPINMSALRIAMQNFDGALAITGAVRGHHLSQLNNSGTVGIWDLYIMARASIALIAYQKRFRGQADTQSTVSDALASQYQFISGVFMICRHMLENADPAIAANDPIAADALYDYADRHGIFISFNDMACAGSTKKIMEFLEFCNTCAEQPADRESVLDDIVSEPGNWYQYALATVELDCFIERERSLRKEESSIVSETDHAKSAQTYSDVGVYVRGLMDNPPLTEARSSFHDGALIRQNQILQLLKRPAIKKLSVKHIGARLG